MSNSTAQASLLEVAQMTCPFDGCETSGTVQGVRRHYGAKHTSDRTKRNAAINEALKAQGLVAAISVYSVTGPKSKDRRAAAKVAKALADKKAADLAKEAKDAGVKGWHKMTKAQLVKALTVLSA